MSICKCLYVYLYICVCDFIFIYIYTRTHIPSTQPPRTNCTSPLYALRCNARLRGDLVSTTGELEKGLRRGTRGAGVKFPTKKTISRRNSARKLEIPWGHQCMLRIMSIWETTQSTRMRWDSFLFNIAMEAMAYQRVKTQQE